MNLVIDIGNTSVKAALFSNRKILSKLNSFAEIKKVVEKEKIECSIISKTGNDHPVEDFISAQKFRKLSFNKHLRLPITSRYATPETVGTDRLALMCAAQHLFPRKNVLCLDTGTCITYNFLNSDGVFEGGAIAPGIEMRFKALHHFTANLPLVNVQKAIEEYQQNNVLLIGNSTESSIMSGVINGVIAETNHLVHQYASKFATLKVIITGTGADFFSKILLNKHIKLPDLQLEGLNAIIEFNS